MQSTVQYEQPVYTDSSFPIILHIDQMHTGRRSIYTNWHAGIEILYCYEGSGRLVYDSEVVPFGEGELVVIGSNVIHTLYLEENPCTYYCMIVEPSFLAAHGVPVERMHLEPIIGAQAAIGLYKQVADTFLERQAYYKPLVLAQVLQLFVHLMQSHMQPEERSVRAGDRRTQRIIVQAIHYIKDHLAEPIHIDQISRHVGMSKYYFCRQFLAYTGTSVNQHINALKCDLARKLLMENGFNVSEAAHYLGFQNLSYFSKLYKKHVGILPSNDLRPMPARTQQYDIFSPARDNPEKKRTIKS